MMLPTVSDTQADWAVSVAGCSLEEAKVGLGDVFFSPDSMRILLRTFGELDDHVST
jgi:hypothetical protein